MEIITQILQKELLPLTGYIHGGCSPLGMKKEFITTIDSSVENHEFIYFSGGNVGIQVKVKLSDLKKVLNFKTYNLIKD